jgi:hypothetical protein
MGAANPTHRAARVKDLVQAHLLQIPQDYRSYFRTELSTRHALPVGLLSPSILRIGIRSFWNPLKIRTFAGMRRMARLVQSQRRVCGMAETYPSPKRLSAREQALRARVLEYLKQHPQAMDTLDGIAEWWVPRQGESIDRRELRTVLGSLAAEGLLEEIHSSSTTRFSLPKRQQSAPPESKPE